MVGNKCGCCGREIHKGVQICEGCARKYGIKWGDSILGKVNEYIEKLEAKNRELRQIIADCGEYKWINCAERMPETSGFYFVIYDSQILMMTFNAEEEQGEQWGYWHSRFDSCNSLIDCDFESVGDEYVSHWLPIPKIPNQTNQEVMKMKYSIGEMMCDFSQKTGLNVSTIKDVRDGSFTVVVERYDEKIGRLKYNYELAFFLDFWEKTQPKSFCNFLQQQALYLANMQEGR